MSFSTPLSIIPYLYRVLPHLCSVFHTCTCSFTPVQVPPHLYGVLPYLYRDFLTCTSSSTPVWDFLYLYGSIPIWAPSLYRSHLFYFLIILSITMLQKQCLWLQLPWNWSFGSFYRKIAEKHI